MSGRPTRAYTNKCAVCNRGFARREHLTRHMRRHTREKPFACLTCSKTFSRLDILHRHRSSHEQSAVEAAATADAAASRACTECAATRVRCSKGKPCARCSQRQLQCVYPTAKRSFRRATRPLEGCAAMAMPRTPDNPAAETMAIANGAHAIISTNAQSSWLEPAPVGAGSGSWAHNYHNSFEDVPLRNDYGSGRQYNINSPYGLDGENYFAGRATNVLSTNWMSPPDQESLTFDSQLASALFLGSGAATMGLPSFLEPIEQTRNSTATWDALDGQVAADRPQMPQEMRGQSSDDIASLAHRAEQSNPVAGSLDSVASTNTTDGEFYVDGAGARAPFKGRLPPGQPVLSVPGLAENGAGRASNAAEGHDSAGQDKELVSTESYNNMVRAIQAECQLQSAQTGWPSFPSLLLIRRFVQLYFDRFHPLFPFIRKASFPLEAAAHWILLLAVATAGATYIRNSDGPQPRNMLLDLLENVTSRRHVRSAPELDPSAAARQDAHLPALQADILALICIIHQGNQTLTRRALAERHRLVEACHCMNLLSAAEDVSSRVGLAPQEWLKRQAEIRTGMMIWFIDCWCACSFGCRPLMHLAEIRAPLPCREHIWDTPTRDGMATEMSQSVTLPEALEILYMEKKLPANLSEFSTVLVIYAIYRKTKEVMRESQTQLSSWTPTARITPRMQPEPLAVGESWPPATSLLSGWRNAATDCLDILHWCANARAARAAGWEHATILHLHLARLILLTPVEHIQILAAASAATATGSAPAGPDDSRYSSARSHVLQWAVRDQFKARLAVVHAGALFWHVRRFSSEGFVEPFGIYLATLVIWAYSLSVQCFQPLPAEAQQPRPQAATASGSFLAAATPPQQTSPATTSTSSEPRSAAAPEPDPDPAFIHLDRPCDDEMVQTFVRQGNRMTGYMLRVGDICDAAAPSKILQEGMRLLVGGQRESRGAPRAASDHLRQGADAREELGNVTWGVERTYSDLLGRMVQAAAKPR